MLIDTYLESLVGSMLYHELVEAGKGVTQDDKAHLRPRVVMTLDNEEPEFWAISHIVDERSYYVWALCVLQGLEPHLAYFDTRIFATWAEGADIPPWDNAFRIYRYQGERTLTQLLDEVGPLLEHPPAWLVADMAASDRRLTIIDGFELAVHHRDGNGPFSALLNEEQMQHMMTNWRSNQEANIDFFPVVKLHLPAIKAMWLLTELNPEDSDTAFGLCDLGMGFPELGYVNLSELTALRGPEELRVMQDVTFVADKPLSEYHRVAAEHGRIIA